MSSSKSSKMNNQSVTPTKERFASVSDMLREQGVSEEVRNRVSSMREQTKVSRQLAELRTRAGLTQTELAERIGCTQSCVSKWESDADENLTLKIIMDYCAATDQRVSLFLGKPMSHVEAVKAYAWGLRDRLKALAALAKDGDDEFEKGIQAFFGEAFFNLLDIFEKCQQELPSGADAEIQIEVQPPKRAEAKLQKATAALAE
jgi:transcriptional regulator with XRE-family HTH domain